MPALKVLVTGGGGFFGTHLVRALDADGHEVHAPRRSELDLLDPESVRTHLHGARYDVVVHTAHENAQRLGVPDSPAILSRNLRMFHALAACSGEFGRLVYYGSGAEFGRERWHARMREDEFGLHLPADEYGFSKWLMNVHARQSERVVNLRCFAVYGPGEDWRTRFLSNAACRTLLGLPIVIRRNVAFDYLHVDDLMDATRWALGAAQARGDFNVCAGEVHELVAVAHRIQELAGRTTGVHVLGEGLGRAYGGDNARFVAASGLAPRVGLDDGLRRLIAYYRERLSTIDPAQFADPASGAVPSQEVRADGRVPPLPR